MFPKFFASTIALLFGIIATAQTIISTSIQYDGSPTPIISNNSSSMFMEDNTHSYKRAVLYTSANEAVMLLKKRKQEGANVVKLTSNGKILWDVTIKDAVLFTGLYNNSIIVLTVPDRNDDRYNSAMIKSVKATLIDLAKGTVSAEKVLWKGEPGVNIDPKVLSLKNGTFKGLVLRYTNADKKRYNRPENEYEAQSHSSKLEWLIFQQSLDQPIVKNISGNVTSDEFLGCDINSNGDLFVVTCTNSSISAEKYTTASNSPVTKAITYYETAGELRKRGTVSCNAEATEQVAVAFRFRDDSKAYSIVAASFDLASGKAYSNTTRHNKEYRKQMDLSQADDLQVQDIMFYNNQVIVAKEILMSFTPAGNNLPTRYNSFETLLSVYDNQMKLKKDIVIPRSLTLYIPAQMKSGHFLNKNILTILYNNSAKGSKIDTKMAIVDLDQLTLTSNNVIEREPVSSSALLEAEATLWFNKTLVLPYIIEDGMGGKNDRTAFQVIKL